ncbi:MAG: BTAD domain-containing putative transcriptional regulator [Actinomycetota bacterium]
MEFHVLGSIEVIDNGTSVTLGPPMHRALLAYLLIHANETVSTDRIIDALWGEAPPRTAKKAVQTYVSSLRKTIGSERIRTDPAGYSLSVEQSELDAWTLSSLVDEADQVLADRPESAIQLLTEADAIWRGRPFGDVTYSEFARAEIRQLEELRARSLESLIEARLAVGHHRETVGQLRSLVAEFPHRERFWGQLMLAYYRSDRQVDALRAFQHASEALAEIGMEPTRNLVELEARIFNQDSTLDWYQPTEEGNLPTPLSSFIGREAEIADTAELLADHRLVTLVGPGGVGKTRLAVEMARTTTDSFTSGSWLVSLAGLANPLLVAAEIMRTLGIYTEASSPSSSQLVDHLRHRDALLVLDNCEHIVDAVATLSTRLLEACPNLKILATSRRPLHVGGEMIYHTQPLSCDPTERGIGAATELLYERARTVDARLPDDDSTRTTAVGVCVRLGGLPLAIELAAAKLRVVTLAELEARIDDILSILADGPRDGPEHHRAIRATLDWSYNTLDDDVRTLFRHLAVFRGGFTLDAVELATDGPVFGPLADLVDASLVMQVDGRYFILEPIRQYASALLDEHAEREEAARAHARAYARIFEPPPELLEGRHTEWLPETVSQFSGEIDNVRVALEWACDNNDEEIISTLAVTACDLFDATSNFREGDLWLHRSLSVATGATRARAKLLQTGVFMSALTTGLDAASRASAELTALAEDLDDDIWRAIALERTAMIQSFEGDVMAASEAWMEAAARLVKADSPEAYRALNNATQTLITSGLYEASLDPLRKLEEVAERFDLHRARYAALAYRMELAVWSGDLEEAVRGDAVARAYAAEFGEYLGSEIDLEAGLFATHIALLQNDLVRARESAEVNLKEAAQGRGSVLMWDACIDMSLVYTAMTDGPLAHRYATEALQIARDLGLPAWQQWALAPMAAATALVNPEQGAKLIGATERLSEEGVGGHIHTIAVALDRARARLQEDLTPGILESAYREGRLLSLEEAVDLALTPL